MNNLSRIILLSGQVGSGKSTAAKGIVELCGSSGLHIKTVDILKEMAPFKKYSRTNLQDLGESLDRKTNGQWILNWLADYIQSGQSNHSVIVVDAVRIEDQIESVRKSYGRKVIHVHLTAENAELERRYRGRQRNDVKELSSYRNVMMNPTESKVGKLEAIADVVINTDRCSVKAVVTRVAAAAGLYGVNHNRLVDVIIGGQFGSEGKGQVAAYLANEYQVLMRVGGPNAGHTVHLYEEGSITHHMLPSGSRKNEQAKILIGPGACINPDKFIQEVVESKIDARRIVIDENAAIIKPADIRYEAGLQKAIGSTGQGVGSAAARRIMERTKGRSRLASNCKQLKEFIGSTFELLELHYARGSKILLEGTQGTGLSLYHGSYPYVTSRDTTVAGCLAEAGISPSRTNRIVMVCRTYPIRVQSPEEGTSGPFGSTLIEWEEIERRAGISRGTLSRKERTSTTNRQRRVAEFDWTLLRKSASLNAPTDVCLTFADYISAANERAVRFDQLSQETIRFIEEIERVCAAPVSLVSTRFHTRGVLDRRCW